ncbi:MAG: tetratricopeptide repeat protein [Nitrospinae bacterium]|nr:tetratricopeptide repeat protein [Nitrospinota bacterium]
MKALDFKDMTVLVVDDMFNMRRTIKNMLRHIGFESVIEAESGQRAWEIISSTPKKIDMVVSDWNMPELPGLELLRRVRDSARHRDTPFIIITAEVSEAKIVQAAETEVDGYLIKPFVAKALEEKINAIFDNRENPPPFEKYLRVGDNAQEAKEYDKAIEAFKEALRIRPDSARARCAIGEAYKLKGNMAEAEKWLAEAIRTNPQYTKAYESMSQVYEAAGKPDLAVKTLEKAAEISPNNPERSLEIGKLYLKQGNKEKADHALQIALKNAGHNAAIHTEIGEVYLTSGDDTRAAAAFSSSINIIEDVHVYNRLAIALRKKGQYDEAYKAYQKALKLSPDDEVLYFNIGRLYMEQDLFKEAEQAFLQALKLDPEFNECKAMLQKLKETAGGRAR